MTDAMFGSAPFLIAVSTVFGVFFAVMVTIAMKGR